MTLIKIAPSPLETQVIEFFQSTQGEWKSQRRYYTLKKEAEPEEVVSNLTIKFLPQGAPELIQLAQLHNLEEETALICGTQVTWHSNYVGKSNRPSDGLSIFGVKGNILYRDRGFATTNPVIAHYHFSNQKTFCLKTEYGGSSFEEEIKLIGNSYRTRQTIISRAGQEIMIGQYLEKRL